MIGHWRWIEVAVRYMMTWPSQDMRDVASSGIPISCANKLATFAHCVAVAGALELARRCGEAQGSDVPTGQVIDGYGFLPDGPPPWAPNLDGEPLSPWLWRCDQCGASSRAGHRQGDSCVNASIPEPFSPCNGKYK